MNNNFDPANVTFGNPNVTPNNFFYQQTQEKESEQPQKQTSTTSNNNKNNNIPFSKKLINFLNSKTSTLLTTAFGLSIGFAFKDFVSSIVTNVLQPFIIKILILLNVNNYYDLSSLISQQNNLLHMKMVLSTFLTFISIVIIVYYINISISVVNNHV